MIGTKWLSEAVDMTKMRYGTINLIQAPAGSGKTTWALKKLPTIVSKPCKMLYLIDTRNGNVQLVSRNPITVVYADSWIAQVKNNTLWFGEAESQNKIVVMTYAKFGMLAEKYPYFGYNFELILCDEIHSLPKFCGFADKNGKSNPHISAQTRLEEIVLNGEQMVIALSATPDRAKNQMRCPFNTIPVDKEVRRLETAEIIPYTNKMNLLEQLSPNQKGIVFFTKVSDMISYQKAAELKGFRVICIWSESNLDHPMDPIQKDAIKYILSNEELPPQYDMIILNASSETSINIYGQVDYIVVHSQQEETQIQIRGRYRQDLNRLYVLDYYSAQVPDEFLDRKLFAEDKCALCEALSIRDEKGRIYKWPKVKEYLFREGYHIRENREKNKRYVYITR